MSAGWLAGRRLPREGAHRWRRTCRSKFEPRTTPALEGVNIEGPSRRPSARPPPPAPPKDLPQQVRGATDAAASVSAAPAAAKAEEKPEEKGATEEEAMAGLGALFG